MKLLAIYIPIYNRSVFLEKILHVFLEDKDLFESKIKLIISDNCSTEDLKVLCESYSEKGLTLTYHQNETNIGGDKNILQGFKTVNDSKYLWILGSDDIPTSGFLRKLVGTLESANYGLVHLNYQDKYRDDVIFENPDMFSENIYVWYTFISINIVAIDLVKDLGGHEFEDTSLSQIPFYLHAAYNGRKNIMVYGPWKEILGDVANNGGYNFFDVFVRQLLTVFKVRGEKEGMSSHTYKVIKKRTCKSFLVGSIYSLLVKKEMPNLNRSKAWSYIFKYYGCHLYLYIYMVGYLLRELFRTLKKKIN